jgi:hypothetical protein
MKKILEIKHLVLAGLLILGLASCKKDDNGGVGGTSGGKGAPTITSIRTVNKTTNDTVTATYTTYDSKGIATTTTSQNPTTQITAFDSTTVTGKLGNYYAVMGANLGSTTKIELNGVSIYFNRALNSDNTVIFNIPSTVPYVQPQANTIVITTLYGSVTYKFTVLPPAPTVISVSDYNFVEGRQLTLNGSGLSSVTAVALKGTTVTATIVSKSDKQMVIKMPATTASRATLLFSYTSGSNTLQAATGQEFVDIDNNYAIFAKDAFQNAWGDNSWASPSGVATGPSVSGTKSLVATYPAGGWQIEGFANWYPSFPYDPAYKFLTFWVKGGTVDHVLNIQGDKMANGYGQNATSTPVKVPANVWTYVKIALDPPSATVADNATTLNFWKTGTTAQQLGFFLKGQTGDVNETMYFDEILFVK